MTPVELAELRDKVARKRLEGTTGRVRVERRNARGWTPERIEAGDRALAALAEAVRRRNEREPLPLRDRCVYCGVGLRPRRRPDWIPATCVKHRDLPGVDPFYLERS